MPTNQIINDVIPWTQISASNAQVVFDTTWTAAYPSDIVVYKRGMNDEPDELTQILLDSEYVVTFVGTAQIVRVTLINPATAGDIVTITRNTAVDRINLYKNTNFVPSMLNQDTALLTLVDQERAMLNDMAVKYHISGPNPNFAATNNLPVVPLGPNQIWATNDNATAIIAYDVPEGGGLATDKAKYIIQEPHAGLPNAQAMSALPTGLVVSNNGTGVQVTRSLEGVPNQTAIFNATGVSDNPIIGIADNPVIPGTAGMGIPEGTTAERVIPTEGIGLRFNTDIGIIEAYIGGQWAEIPSSSSGAFLPLSGGKMTGNIDMDGNEIQNAELSDATLITPLDAGNQLINNAATPIADSDVATKGYVDQSSLNGASVYAATTTNLTVTQSGTGVGATLTNAGTQAVFSIDGVSPPLGSNILVKNLASAANEGIYTLTNVGSVSTNWILTRASSYDTATEINNTGLIIVRNGSTLAGTAWYNTATIVTVDTTPFSYSSFGISLPVSVANGGTSRSALDAYRIIAGGTTNTGVVQSVNPGSNGQLLQSKGNAALPDYTTATYPNTVTANNLLYASGINAVGQLTPGAGVLTALAAAVAGSGSIALQSSGSWTPTFTFATPGNLSVSYGNRIGFYLRIGNLVMVKYTIIFTPTFSTSSGVAIINGLPIAAAVNSLDNFGNSANTAGMTYGTSRTYFNARVSSGSNAISMMSYGSGIDAKQIGPGNFSSGIILRLDGQIIYQV